MKTREVVQNEALEALVQNNYNGTICFSTGTGKSYTAIQAIKKGNFRNILITSPRTNLKINWNKELEKWGKGWLFGDTHKIIIENIQTCYTWSLEKIQQFDYIIQDEIHTMVTPEYGRLINLAKSLNIPVTGLTATPDYDKEEKKLFYETYCPIVYEYYDSAKDGIVNKRRYFKLSYELSDTHLTEVVTKTAKWKQGEKSRYEYIESIFASTRNRIESVYFDEVKTRMRQVLSNSNSDPYRHFLQSLISNDLSHFKTLYWDTIKSKTAPYDLYMFMRFIQDVDYTALGMKAALSAKKAPDTLKPEFFKYIWARNERKSFLWNLTSSAWLANKVKSAIIQNDDNKVLLFSELTQQANKLSVNTIHSKRKIKSNVITLQNFDDGTIKELASCNSLTLGLNIKGANYAIVESFNGSNTLLTQKAGRLDRIAVDEISTIIFIVPKNTQAEVWYDSATTKLTGINELIEVNTVDELIKLL